VEGLIRILHIVPGLSFAYGGPSKITMDMACALMRQGMHIEIATTDADIGGNMAVLLRQPTEQQGVPVRYFHSPYGQKYGFSPDLIAWCRQHVSAYDIVHFHAFFSHVMLATWACRRQQVPYIVRPIGQLDAWSYQHNPLRKRLFLRLVGRLALKGAAAIHVTSLAELAHVKAWGLGTPCVTIPLGIDLPPLVERLEQAQPNLLFLSRLDRKKGLHWLVQAIHRLQQRGVKLRLTIAGSGDQAYEAEIRAQVLQLGLQEIVYFAGFVSGDTKTTCFTQADLFVLPSQDENFGVAVAEALGHGLPVVVSQGVALAADIETAGAGLVTPIGAVEPLADAIARLVGSPALRCTMGQKARQLAAEKFAWESISHQIIALYGRILQQHSRTQQRVASNVS